MLFKHVAVVTLCLLSLVFVGTVQAEENDTNGQTIRQERRETFADKRSKKLAEHCQLINQRISSMIIRVESRIAKQKADGKDVSTAEAAVAEGKTHLASGASLCDQAVAKFDSVPAESWSEQQSIVREARALAKQAREAFVKARQSVGKAIRALFAEAKPTATPTDE
jgi:hypothetical protein